MWERRAGEQQRELLFSAQVCPAQRELVNNVHWRAEDILCNALYGDWGQHL